MYFMQRHESNSIMTTTSERPHSPVENELFARGASILFSFRGARLVDAVLIFFYEDGTQKKREEQAQAVSTASKLRVSKPILLRKEKCPGLMID